MSGTVVAVVGFLYLGVLFCIAFWADQQADRGRLVINHGIIYALSLAVYCTSWTFFGSVGLAAHSGIGFLPIYLGPTLMMVLGFVILAKILRISKKQRITTIADFIAARYGKNQVLGGWVALIAVIVVTPYIALQLKAISTIITILHGGTMETETIQPWTDYLLFVTLVMIAFAIIFGTRQIDAAEHHPGVVAAIAFESLIKLLAFLAVGIFVVFFLYNGIEDLFQQVLQNPELHYLFTPTRVFEHGEWIATMFVTSLAILCLPRQFQVLVIENVNEKHLARALWLFPLYLLLINIFVLPIAAAGLLLFPEQTVNPDSFVLVLPFSAQWKTLTLFVFVGGLSAATGMVIVETIALSTMMCNNLVIPIGSWLGLIDLTRSVNISYLLLNIRRVSIGMILLLGYFYVFFAGSSYTLVSIGLISMAGVSQFAPSLIGAVLWSGATRRGALVGLVAGFALWTYTLILPSFARSGWLPEMFITEGPWGIEWLHPYALFGLKGLDELGHSLFWSMFVNVGCFIGISCFDRPSLSERVQATAFVEVFQPKNSVTEPIRWQGTAKVEDLTNLVVRFLGKNRTKKAFAEYQEVNQLEVAAHDIASSDLVQYSERLLTGAIGSASARIVLSTSFKDQELNVTELMRMLDETSHMIEYSRQLEQKSQELEKATQALKDANEKLRELDRMKDDFLSTITHELRTPLTSIRAFSEILYDNPEIELQKRQEFLSVIIKESERLTRLINQVLDFAKIESDQVKWNSEPIALDELITQAAASISQLFYDKGITFSFDKPEQLPLVQGDSDRVMQVIVNLLSNALKFTHAGGRVSVALCVLEDKVQTSIQDSGIGMAKKDLKTIFERFRQVGMSSLDKPQGTGLGLAICKKIINHLGGNIWVHSQPNEGTTFFFTLPMSHKQQG